MTDQDQMIFAVVLATLLLLAMVIVMGILMFVNTTRRHRFRAELAEADLRRNSEVMNAEREATEQTLAVLGRELHDNVGQLLQVAQMGLLNKLEATLPDDVPVATAMGALEEGIQEVKRLGRTLNTDLWRERSLEDALRAEATRLERMGHAQVDLELNGTSATLPDDRKTILFRSFQEVISNALKHSGADRFTIRMNGAHPFSMSVADNGKGFDPDRVKKGSGLFNIQRRCELVGCIATLDTMPGKGCCWTFTTENENEA